MFVGEIKMIENEYSRLNEEDRKKLSKVHDSEYRRLVGNGENVCFASFMADVAAVREMNKLLEEYKKVVSNGEV